MEKIEPISVTDDGGSGPGPVPDERRDKEATVRLFDEANGRVSSTAARRQLDRIAGNFEELADSAGVSSWTLVGSAIEEAVSSGSAFVAPKRIREILTRWNRDGVPGMYAGNAQGGDDASRPVTSHVTEAVTSGEGASHRFVRTPGGSAAGSVMLPVDRDPADIWDSTCGLLQGSLTAAAIDRLRNGVLISGYDAGVVYLTTSTSDLADEIAGGWQDTIQRKLAVVLRRPVRVKVSGPTPVPPNTRPGDKEVGSAGKRRTTSIRPPAPVRIPVFSLPECGMTSTQVWMSVLDDLQGSGAIPKPEIVSWLRDSVLLGRDEHDDALIVGVPHALAERRAARFLSAIETAAMHIVGFDCAIRIVRTQAWLSAREEGTGTEG
jgi:hypothetical protein